MMGRAYIPRTGRGEESQIARVQLTSQLTVTFFCWPPQTNMPLFFGLSKSVWGFEKDGLDRWDIYYSSYWSRILKKACRVITAFGFVVYLLAGRFVILVSKSTIIRNRTLLCVFELGRKFKTCVRGQPKLQWTQTLLPPPPPTCSLQRRRGASGLFRTTSDSDLLTKRSQRVQWESSELLE